MGLEIGSRAARNLAVTPAASASARALEHEAPRSVEIPVDGLWADFKWTEMDTNGVQSSLRRDGLFDRVMTQLFPMSQDNLRLASPFSFGARVFCGLPVEP